MDSVRATALYAILASSIALSNTASAQDNHPLSTPGLPETCKVLPDKPLSEGVGEYPVIRCEWLSQVKVVAGQISGGTAGVDTSDQREVYDLWRAVQEDFVQAFDGQQGMSVNVESNVVDCAESRKVVWNLDGVPMHSVFTAYCGGIGINYATAGADFTQADSAKFAQIIRSVHADKAKILR
jgi:hypothetical protein